MLFAIDYHHNAQNSRLGLSVAVEGLTRAWLTTTQSAQIICHSTDPASHRHFLAMAQESGIETDKKCYLLNPAETPDALGQLDCLFIPDPDIAKPSWHRARVDAAHAVCGLVHSMSGEQIAQVAWNMCLAPLRESDALICPSRAIRDSVLKHWDIHCAYLSHRFGTKATCPVQTPVIPLGIDTQFFENQRSEDKRTAQRAALGCTDEEIVILFVGRLNFATKAHPLPLLLAAQQAAKLTKKKVRLILYGYFLPAADMAPRYRALLEDFACEPLQIDLIENTDPRFPNGLMAAADIFASLVDNVQESFGLTPIEALASGLPPVVTDWDGYRDGVRHGTDGFLVPTYAPPSTTGMDIAARYSHDRHYGAYLMGAAQSTAIDIPAAARAFLTLIEDDDARRLMGEAGKTRAREQYDWRVIIPAYEALWQEQAARAKTLARKKELPDHWPAIAPTFPNPWSVFESFPSHPLTPTMTLSLAMKERDVLKILRHDMNIFSPTLLLPQPLLFTLIETIGAHGQMPIQRLLDVTPAGEHNRLWRSIGWMVKHGLAHLGGK